MAVNVQIIDETSCYSDEPSDEEDEWYRPNSYTDHEITGFKIDSGYFDLATDFVPEYNTPYYLLFAVWSSGDSFGYDSGAYIEYFGLFENEEIAKLNEQRINDKKENLLTDFGMDIPLHIPWDGYFDGLDYLRIEKVYRK